MITGMRFLDMFKSERTLAVEREIAQLQAEEAMEAEQYWFDNPFGFECQVTLMEPRERTARVGAYGDGLFGSVPVPFHGQFNDWGTFQVQRGRFVFLGRHTTRIVEFNDILHTTHYPDGVQFNVRQGVVGFRGPVRSAVIGALSQMGFLPPATYQGSLS
jgi:hypothetical protein